jgi:addiction module HigA family antidote
MNERIILTVGDILKMEFLEPLKISQYRLAKEIGVSNTLINKIVKGKQGLSPDIAFRLSVFFGTTAKFWLNLYNNCELEKIQNNFKINPINIIPYKNNKKKLA